MTPQTCNERTLTGVRIRWPARCAWYAVLAAVLGMSACGEGPAGIPGGEPASLTVTPELAEPVAVGDELALGAEVRDRDGRMIADATVSWASSDPEVAAVGPEGVVTAVGQGTATITAVAGGASATVQFSVADPAYAVLLTAST